MDVRNKRGSYVEMPIGRKPRESMGRGNEKGLTDKQRQNNRRQTLEQEANDWIIDKSKRQLNREATGEERAPHMKGWSSDSVAKKAPKIHLRECTMRNATAMASGSKKNYWAKKQATARQNHMTRVKIGREK
jgi:hypothetical protein